MALPFMEKLMPHHKGVRRLRLSLVALVLAAAQIGTSTQAAGQPPEDLKGEAALKHPAGQLAVRAADLLAAGKIEEVIALGPKSGRDEWKKAAADERQGVTQMMKKRAPAAGTYADAIRKAGVLAIMGNSAVLRVDMAKGDAAIAYFELEGGQWRITNGPMVITGAETAGPVNETRIEGADLVNHPVAALAAQYVELVHAGKMEDAMRLATTEAQQQWKAEPASERAASAAFRKKTLPTAAELKAALPAGSVLIIEDGQRAMLNIIKKEQRPGAPGVVNSSSTTIAIGFAMENGKWRLAR